MHHFRGNRPYMHHWHVKGYALKCGVYIVVYVTYHFYLLLTLYLLVTHSMWHILKRLCFLFKIIHIIEVRQL